MTETDKFYQEEMAAAAAWKSVRVGLLERRIADYELSDGESLRASEVHMGGRKITQVSLRVYNTYTPPEYYHFANASPEELDQLLDNGLIAEGSYKRSTPEWVFKTRRNKTNAHVSPLATNQSLKG